MADAPPRSTFAEYSQKQTKVSGHKVCSIPLQASEWRQHSGVSFDFNEAPVKMAGY